MSQRKPSLFFLVPVGQTVPNPWFINFLHMLIYQDRNNLWGDRRFGGITSYSGEADRHSLST